MRHRTIPMLTLCVIALMSLPSIATAQEEAVQDGLIGTWLVDVDVSDTADSPALLTISDDGTLRLTDCCNYGAGAWASTEDGTADATVLLPWWDDEGFIGYAVIRGHIELDSGGESFAATYTQEVPSRNGETSGQLGPVEASGQRVSVEPMGEPVGPIPAPSPMEGEGADASPSPSPVPG